MPRGGGDGGGGMGAADAVHGEGPGGEEASVAATAGGAGGEVREAQGVARRAQAQHRLRRVTVPQHRRGMLRTHARLAQQLLPSCDSIMQDLYKLIGTNNFCELLSVLGLTESAAFGGLSVGTEGEGRAGKGTALPRRQSWCSATLARAVVGSAP